MRNFTVMHEIPKKQNTPKTAKKSEKLHLNAKDPKNSPRKEKRELHLNARDPLESAQLLKLQLWLHEVDHTFVQRDPRNENDEYLAFFMLYFLFSVTLERKMISFFVSFPTKGAYM